MKKSSFLSFFFLISTILTFSFSSCAFFENDVKARSSGSGSGSITISFGSNARDVSSEKSLIDDDDYIRISLRGGVDQTQTVQYKDSKSITFTDIPVGSQLYAEATIFFKNEIGNEVTKYEGTSDPITIQDGPNSLSIKLHRPGESGEEVEYIISINDEDEYYASGSKIILTLTDSDNNPVSADNLVVEFHMTGYDEITDVDYDDVVEESQDWFSIDKSDNQFIITTSYPDTMNTYDNGFYLLVNVSGDSIQQKFDFNLIPGIRPPILISMIPRVRDFANGSTIKFIAKDSDNNPLPANKLSLSVKYNDKGNLIDENSSNYSTNVDGNYLALSPLSLTVGNEYKIIMIYDENGNDETEKNFTVTITRSVVTQTINVTGKSEAAITSELNSIISGDNIYKLKFTGTCNISDFNLYSSVKTILGSHIQLTTSYDTLGGLVDPSTPDPKTVYLDFSGCTGSSLATIPAETFQGVGVIGSLILSDSTTSVGASAFGAEDSYTYFWIESLDLNNVTEIGMDAFQGAKFTELKMPKVTLFGSGACSEMNADYVSIDSAQDLYGDDDGHGYGVFSDSSGNTKIKELYAPKLRIIDNGNFTRLVLEEDFVIPETIVFVGGNALNINSYSDFDLSKVSSGTWYTDVDNFKEITIGAVNCGTHILEAIAYGKVTWEQFMDYIAAQENEDEKELSYYLTAVSIDELPNKLKSSYDLYYKTN